MADGNQLANAYAANDYARARIIAEAMPMENTLPPVAVQGNVTVSNNIVTIQPRLVGLLCGLLVEVDCTFTNSGANAGARTDLGALNIVERFQFTDLSNQVRHSTKGAHIGLLNSCKMGSWFGGAVAPNLPYNVGNVNTVSELNANIASGGGTRTGRVFYYIPIAYNMLSDLRGAIWANVTNAQYQLQITLNANGGAIATDPNDKIYTGLVAATDLVMSNATIKVTQIYYDQLPKDGNGAPLLPWIDLSWNYCLNDTVWTGLTANNENAYPYANYKTFLSTLVRYDNNGTFNLGTDISYWALKYANTTIQWQKNPKTIFNAVRNQIGFDLPPAFYYFDHRTFPIATANFGNADLVVYPTTVTSGTGSFNWVGYEYMQPNATMRNATSLPSGG